MKQFQLYSDYSYCNSPVLYYWMISRWYSAPLLEISSVFPKTLSEYGATLNFALAQTGQQSLFLAPLRVIHLFAVIYKHVLFLLLCLKLKGVKLQANDTKMLVQVHFRLEKMLSKDNTGIVCVHVKETICRLRTRQVYLIKIQQKKTLTPKHFSKPLFFFSSSVSWTRIIQHTRKQLIVWVEVCF